MSLGTRIALGVALVLALTMAALGAILVRTTRATLMAEIDDRLVTSVERAEGLAHPFGDDRPVRRGRGGPSHNQQPADDIEAEDLSPDVAGRNVGLYIFGPDGSTLLSRPSGYDEAPDPPPALPTIPGPQSTALMGRIITLPAVDGTMHYRVLLRPGPHGATYVTAASMRPVETAVARLVRTLIVAGLLALTAASLASWFVIRRALRPVDRMVETAAAIADGDLSRRVPDADPGTELGRLGTALNEMLGQIEAGIREREVGEVRLRRFVADAAHELRTPLTSLRGYAELYRRGALPTEGAVGNAMGRIESEGARMARLVDDLLLLARTDQGRALEKEPVDLVRLAREAAGDFAAADPSRPLQRDLDGSAVVVGDPIRLRQAIDNLLANVRAHTPEETPTRVSVRRDGAWAEVIVADAGPGIPSADQPRIFERFWRGDPARGRTSSGGAGLGLSIVDALVRAHGGSVVVQSAPGQGTAFTLRFPLAPTESGAA
ncbi:MAG: HAMP domain-containing protein [Thermomicrobiales bacterium]|nr:HAMP domain-containing protein [Thermomicrobiales bacterium]